MFPPLKRESAIPFPPGYNDNNEHLKYASSLHNWTKIITHKNLSNKYIFSQFTDAKHVSPEK